MSRVESGGQARQQLERILASPVFTRNERLSRFLRFIVERHLDGRDEELKESLIAIEVFGRPPGYDSKRDPIVRTEASRLRTKLTEYYLGEGKNDSLIIDLPKGGYVPAFRTDAIGQLASPARKSRRLPLVATALGCLLVVLGIAAWWWFHKNAPITIAVPPRWRRISSAIA